MRALVVYCHPSPTSFTAAVRDTVLARLRAAGASTRTVDLHADGFQPILTEAEWTGYLDSPANRRPVETYCADLEWCDTLIFVYPTWWYGLPATLKGWLDRVMLPDMAFLMPTQSSKTIRPALTHITRLGIYTTCGASRALTFFVGSPGRRTLQRGLGLLLHPRARKAHAAHYLMDSSTPQSRAAHLVRVGRSVDRLIAARAPASKPVEIPA